MSKQGSQKPIHSVTQETQAGPPTLLQAAIAQQGLFSHWYLRLKAGQEWRACNDFSLFFKVKMYKVQEIFHAEKTKHISAKGARRNI